MRARVGGVNTTSLIGDAFRKAKYEIAVAKKEVAKTRAGKKLVLSVVERIPSPTPFLFARPSVRFLPRKARQSVGVSFKIGSHIVE